MTIVNGTIYKANKTPWKDAPGLFELLSGSYTSEFQYPKVRIPFRTNALGRYSVELWEDESGVIATKWQCRHPSGEMFQFSIPAGMATAEISFLRAINEMSTPPAQNVIYAYVVEKLTEHNADPSAHGGALVGGGNAASPPDSFTPTLNQTSFTLSLTPAAPSSTRLFLNGEKQRYGTAYTINGAILNWLGSRLDGSDFLELYRS
jgi:hypothetical protein